RSKVAAFGLVLWRLICWLLRLLLNLGLLLNQLFVVHGFVEFLQLIDRLLAAVGSVFFGSSFADVGLFAASASGDRPCNSGERLWLAPPAVDLWRRKSSSSHRDCR